jgi:hypothetical protein
MALIASLTDGKKYEATTIPAVKKRVLMVNYPEDSDFSEFFIHLFKEIPLYINKQCRVF